MNRPLSHPAAICFAIAGFTCWVLCDSVIKLAGQSQLPVYEIVAFLGIFMAMFIAVYAACRGDVPELWPKRPKRLLVRSCLDVGNNLCVVVALRHLSLTLFYILVFTSPLLVAVLGRVFLRERLDWRKSLAIMAGFLGILVAVYPSRATGSSAWLGVGACAVCITCFSIVIVWSRVISQTERAETMTFFSGLVSAVVGLLGMVVFAVPVRPGLLMALLVMGLLGALGNICVFTALRATTAATVSQYHYTQLVSGTIVAYLLFRERPTSWMLAGAALIVASGLYVAIRSPRANPPAQLKQA